MTSSTTTGTSKAMTRLIGFVNTFDVENAVDELDSPEALRTWLQSHGLADEQLQVDDRDVEQARALREGLRHALLAHDAHGEAGGGDAGVVTVPLQLQITPDGDAVLVPAAGGVAAALARLVADIPAAAADGTWQRVKACPDTACHWAFLDQSRNRSRRWCSMEVCGNRQKTRTFRDRRRSDELAQHQQLPSS